MNLRNPSARLPIIREFAPADCTPDPSTPNTPHFLKETQSSEPHTTQNSDKPGEVSSNFFVETLLSLGQPIDESYSSSDWDYGEADAPFEKADEQRVTDDREELPLQLLRARPSVRTDHDQHLDPEVLNGAGVIDPETLFPPPRSADSLNDLAGGISISLALIDGPDALMLYEEWKRRTQSAR